MKQLSAIVILGSLILSQQMSAQRIYGDEPLAHTYSIVAIDKETGEMGVAVQSHWFSVGTIVAWGQAGVGVVATQSFVNPAYGPDGLQLMSEGLSATMALQQLVAKDEGEGFRQIAFLDVNGDVDAHTGSLCIESAGHYVGEGYSVQANMMDNETIWPEMAKAFEASSGQPMADRLLQTLLAAEAAGGDIRGKQSAAMKVFKIQGSGKVWEDKTVDLRVDDNPEPLQELQRLLKVHKAYQHMNAGDLAIEHGDVDLAMEEYGAAEKMFPDNVEMKYWHAVSLANVGQWEEAKPLFQSVFAENNNWKKLTQRITVNGLLTVDAETLQKILAL